MQQTAMILIKQYDIWLAYLNPAKGTEPGKIRPVAIVQTNLLNNAGHPSTIVCPITTNVQDGFLYTRIRLDQLDRPSDVLIDQIRTIDNRRLKGNKRISYLSDIQILKMQENLKIIFDIP